MWISHSISYVQVGFAINVNVILQKDVLGLSFQLPAPGCMGPSDKQEADSTPTPEPSMNCVTSYKLLNLSEPNLPKNGVDAYFKGLWEHLRNSHTELGKWLLVVIYILI